MSLGGFTKSNVNSLTTNILTTDNVCFNQTTTPSPTTNKLYNVNGELFWNSTRVGGFVNVKDNGVKGDGITDDTTAIQTLLTNFTGTTNPKIIFFPAGVYIVSATLTVATRDCYIQGTGQDATIIQSSSTSLSTVFDFGTTNFVKGYIKDLTVRQILTPTATIVGITITDAAQFHFTDVSMIGFTKCLVLSPPTGSRVAYCAFRNVFFNPNSGFGTAGDLSFEVTGTGFANQNDFYNCRFTDDGGAAFAVKFSDGIFYNANHFLFCVFETLNGWTEAAVIFGTNTRRNLIFGSRFEGVSIGITDSSVGENSIFDFNYLSTVDDNSISTNSFLMTRDEMRIPTELSIQEHRQTLSRRLSNLDSTFGETDNVPLFLLDNGISGTTGERTHFKVHYSITSKRAIATRNTGSWRGNVSGIIGSAAGDSLDLLIHQLDDQRTDDIGLYEGATFNNDMDLTVKASVLDDQFQLYFEFVNSGADANSDRSIRCEIDISIGTDVNGNLTIITLQNVGDSLIGGSITTADDFKILTTNGSVGIRTTSPSDPLHVVGDIRTTTAYNIGAAEVLSATTLGGAVVNSSLTSVGTLADLTVAGIVYGGGQIVNSTVLTTSDSGSIFEVCNPGNIIITLPTTATGLSFDFVFGVVSGTVTFTASGAHHNGRITDPSPTSIVGVTNVIFSSSVGVGDICRIRGATSTVLMTECFTLVNAIVSTS